MSIRNSKFDSFFGSCSIRTAESCMEMRMKSAKFLGVFLSSVLLASLVWASFSKVSDRAPLCQKRAMDLFHACIHANFEGEPFRLLRDELTLAGYKNGRPDDLTKPVLFAKNSGKLFVKGPTIQVWIDSDGLVKRIYFTGIDTYPQHPL